METTATPVPAPAPAPPKSLCSNCGAQLQGPHCYSCGQPVKGMIRPLSSMLHDIADTIFNIDSRIFRTLLPLYFKPGYLSTEYFAGRRVRYVTPFRLYFFLSVAAFLLMQIGLDSSFDAAKDAIHLGDTNTAMVSAKTPEEVIAKRDAVLAQLDKAMQSRWMNDEGRTAIEQEKDKVRAQAQKRLDRLEARKAKDAAPSAPPDDAAPAPPAPPAPPPVPVKPEPAKGDAAKPAADSHAAAKGHDAKPTPGDAIAGSAKSDTDKGPDAKPPSHHTSHAKNDDEDGDFEIDWNPEKDPIHVAWLPEFVNAKLTNSLMRMKQNLPKIKDDPKPFLVGAFGTLPQVLFVLMPLFALLLKVFYIFRRRLYMEHLIVALHSHAFIFQSLLFVTLAILARSWAREHAVWLQHVLGWVIFAMCWWIPLYLLLTAKKVYRQGWFFTILKFCMIGLCYTIMISCGVVIAFAISLATT